MVVTVVDMIPELMPDLFASGGQHLAKEAFVRQASAVVCISESTRRDLLRLLGPLDAVVEVVPLAVGANFRPGQRYGQPLPDDYLLFVGNRGTYKDFAVALEAFAGVRAGHPGLNLVAVGGGQFTQGELDAFRRLSVEGSVHRVDASDDDLPAPVRRRAGVPVPLPLRGLRVADARGDGVRDAGHPGRLVLPSGGGW